MSRSLAGRVWNDAGMTPPYCTNGVLYCFGVGGMAQACGGSTQSCCDPGAACVAPNACPNASRRCCIDADCPSHQCSPGVGNAAGTCLDSPDGGITQATCDFGSNLICGAAGTCEPDGLGVAVVHRGDVAELDGLSHALQLAGRQRFEEAAQPKRVQIHQISTVVAS